MSKTKSVLKAFRIEHDLDKRLKKMSEKLNVTSSWLIRDYIWRGLAHDEEGVRNGSVREVRDRRS
jgi:predicted DNA-binding protein